MPFSSGTYTITSNSFAPSPVTGTTISSSAAQSTWSDLSTGLSTCLLKDGSQTATSSIPFAAGISVVSPLITTSTTFALVNTTATTINFGGAATAINMGAGASATLTASFTTAIALNTGAVTTNQTTLALMNTTATTINFAGAATTLNIGAATGTITIAGSMCPQNSQSTAYTTVAADANKHILHPTADNSARTFTIDSNANVAYPIGTMITFVNQINTVTIAITADTLTLMGSGATGSRTLAANGIATALKVAATSWVIAGTNLS